VHKINNSDLRSQILNMNSWNDVATFSVAHQFGFIAPSCLLFSAIKTLTLNKENDTSTYRAQINAVQTVQCAYAEGEQ